MITRYKGSEQDQAILDVITDQIERGLAQWYGESCSLVSRMPELRSYTNSFLMRYQVGTPAGRRAVLVKIRRTPKMESLNQAVQASEIHANIPDEYHAMQLLHEKIGGEHTNFTAIRPLGYLEEYHAILMEEFPSRSLRQLLENPRTHEEKRNRVQVINHAARKAGELLRYFHNDVQTRTECPYRMENLLAEVGSYAARLEKYSDGHVTSRTLVEEFGQTVGSREIRSIWFTGNHQDLTWDNVLYSESGKACLIDIKTKPGPIYSDLALLLVHPETFRSQIFRGGMHFSDALLQGYRSAILDGYFAQEPRDHFLMNLFCAIRILDKWTMHTELLHRYKGLKRVATRPMVPIVNRYFEALFKRYLNTAIQQDHFHPLP